MDADKVVECITIGFGEPGDVGECGSEQAASDDSVLLKIDVPCGMDGRGQIAFLEQALADEQFRRDQPGRACEGGIGRVRPETRRRAGWGCWEHLPPAHAGFLEIIGKLVRRRADVAGGKWAGQAGGMKQYSRGAGIERRRRAARMRPRFSEFLPRHRAERVAAEKKIGHNRDMPESQEGKIWDAIIVGGGPAGAIAALSLARRGRSAILLEKANFPRFHVGESFLPAAFNRLKQLGLEPALREIPHVPKFGAHFQMGSGGRVLEIDFLDGFCDGTETFNVERSIFDDMLLKQAELAGVEVRQGLAVKEILNLADGDVRVRTETGEIRGKYLLDASGQGSVVGRHLGTRKAMDASHLKKVAYGGHFENVPRGEGRQAGHPLIVMMEEGWFWVIPLNPTKTSVGLVLDAEVARNLCKSENISPDRMLSWGIARCPAMKQLMSAATGTQANIVVADFSYTCRPVRGGWVFFGRRFRGVSGSDFFHRRFDRLRGGHRIGAACG